MKNKFYKVLTLIFSLLLVCVGMFACVGVNGGNNDNPEEEPAPPVDPQSPVYTITLIYGANNLVENSSIDLTGLPTSIQIRYNEQVNLPTYSSNGIKGYTIEGWLDESGNLFEQKYYKLNRDLTLKAKWGWIG